jgi:hypothetical protein
MTELNTAITQADLERWYKMKQDLAELKTAESLLRKRIYAHYFPAAVEGTNTFNLGDGYDLKATRVVERKVDEGELAALEAAIKAEGSNLPKLPLRKLVRWKPELAKSEYNKLTAEEQKLFDRALIIKDGSPQLEIKKPARPAA